MNFRRLVCLLLGIWIGGSAFMMTVATQNFRSVDRLMDRPPQTAALIIQELGHDVTRSFLRFQASELNRFYFAVWETVQIFLGIAVLGVLLWGTHERTFTLLAAVLMLVIVLIMRLALTPEIVSLGRAVDFLAAEAPSDERSRFWAFHGVYSGLEFFKLALAALLAFKLLLRGRHSSRHARKDLDMVDVPDHRHIDG